VWLLDLGNTRLKLTRTGPAGRGPVLALAHAEAGFEAALDVALAAGPDDGIAWLASVAAAPVREAVVARLAARGLRVETAATRAACAGLRIAYADPARLGVDRFLALLAAHHRGGDWLLASVGSAITVDLLEAGGRHHGGLIGIAPAHQVQALRERFPALDRGEGEATPAFATDTPDALAAGARRQALGLLLAAWDDACAALGRAPRLLLAGGDAAAFAPALAQRLAIEVDIAETLVLEGLQAYAREAGAG
jgi:type III pantothenate kinase